MPHWPVAIMFNVWVIYPCNGIGMCVFLCECEFECNWVFVYVCSHVCVSVRDCVCMTARKCFCSDVSDRDGEREGEREKE